MKILLVEKARSEQRANLKRLKFEPVERENGD